MDKYNTLLSDIANYLSNFYDNKHQQQINQEINNQNNNGLLVIYVTIVKNGVIITNNMDSSINYMNTRPIFNNENISVQNYKKSTRINKPIYTPKLNFEIPRSVYAYADKIKDYDPNIRETENVYEYLEDFGGLIRVIKCDYWRNDISEIGFKDNNLFLIKYQLYEPNNDIKVLYDNISYMKIQEIVEYIIDKYYNKEKATNDNISTLLV